MAQAMAKAPRKPASPSAPERQRGGEARAIADLVPSVGGTAFRRFGFIQSSLITRWPEIVGARIARVSAPESLRFPQGKKADGTLNLSVTGAHAILVQHAIPDIIARVNAFFGYAAVRSIKLKQGRALPEPVPASERTSAPPPPAAPAGDTALTTIADPELRTVLSALAASLSRRDAPEKNG